MSNDSVDSGGSLDHFSRAERLHPSIQLHQTYTPKKESCLVSPNSTASSTPSPGAKKSSSSSEKSSGGKVAKKHKKKHRKHHHCNKHKHKSKKQQHGSPHSATNTSGSSGTKFSDIVFLSKGKNMCTCAAMVQNLVMRAEIRQLWGAHNITYYGTTVLFLSLVEIRDFWLLAPGFTADKSRFILFG